jgi:hypothetical protein
MSFSSIYFMIYIARLHRRRLKADRESLGLHATDSQKSKIQLRSNNLRRKITSWTTIQQLYIPNVHVLRSRDHATHDGQEEVPEKTELYLPSSICRSDQVNVCDLRLMKVEWMLRVPQANDALDSLRDGLRVRSFLYMDKDHFQRGQHANTRSRGIIARIEAKIAAAAATYTVAREALISLSSPLDQVGCETSFPTSNYLTFGGSSIPRTRAEIAMCLARSGLPKRYLQKAIEHFHGFGRELGMQVYWIQRS